VRLYKQHLRPEQKSKQWALSYWLAYPPRLPLPASPAKLLRQELAAVQIVERTLSL